MSQRLRVFAVQSRGLHPWNEPGILQTAVTPAPKDPASSGFFTCTEPHTCTSMCTQAHTHVLVLIQTYTHLNK